MALPFEVRKRYREIFWGDYSRILRDFIANADYHHASFPTLRLRLCQAMVQFFFRSVNKVIESSTTISRPVLLTELEEISHQGVTWELKTHRLRFTLKGRLLLAKEFLLLWGYFTVLGFWESLHAGTVTSAAFFLGYSKDMYYRNGSFDSFRRFLHEGPVPALRKARAYVVQGDPTLTAQEFHLSARPLLLGVRLKQRNWSDPLRLLRHQLRSLCQFLVQALRRPEFLLMSKDLAYMGLAAYLNDQGFIEDVFLTQSDVQEQKLWLTDLANRKFQVHMLWYSVNSRPFRFSEDHPLDTHPNFFNSRCDVHYVWRAEEKAWLESLIYFGCVEVVGPILFYLPEGRSLLPMVSGREFNAVIFDVAPIHRHCISSSFYSFYKFENCCKFIEDIDRVVRKVEAETGTKINVHLKPKRAPSGISDLRYSDCFKGKAIERLDSHSNIFDLVSQADLVFISLYSSPMFIAPKGRAVYYDATEMVWNDFPDLPFAQTPAQLEAFIKTVISARTA